VVVDARAFQSLFDAHLADVWRYARELWRALAPAVARAPRPADIDIEPPDWAGR